MIDFRYHIVSIVSIFLALAVGIVLGAGPLKGEIGSTLQSEIAGLRDDKAQLNDQLQEAKAQAEQRDTYLEAMSSRIVAGALDGRSVALVVLPGADAALGDSVTEAVGAAGGTVASTTSVDPDWVSTDDGVRTTREAAVQEVAKETGVDPTASGSDLPPRDVLLASLLTRSAPVGDSGPDDATALEGLRTFADAGLLSLDSDQLTRAELVVVVGGAVTDGDQDTQTAAAQGWVELTSALDTRSRGAVLAADIDSEGDGVSVLATLRKNSDVASAVSGVDDAADPMGLSSVVFALREQDGGSSGQYGLAPGTDAAFAPPPGS